MPAQASGVHIFVLSSFFIGNASKGLNGKPIRHVSVAEFDVASRTGALQAQSFDAWKPAEAFESGIRKTVQWFLDHPEWVANVQSGSYRQWVQAQYATELTD